MSLDNDLTVEEQAQLAELNASNPDAKPQSYGLQYPPEKEQLILACCFKVENFLETASVFIEDSGAFVHQARAYIFSYLKAYWKEHQAVPTIEECQWYIEEANQKGKLPASKPDYFFLGELNLIRDEVEPHLHQGNVLLKELEKFARLQDYRKSYNKEIKLIEEDKWDEVDAYRKSHMQPSLKPKQLAESWLEVLETAEKQKEDWCIPNWCEYGCMTLFSSKPKMGKSTIMSQLIVSAMLGEDFYGMDLNPAPILLIDPENRQKTLVRRLNHCLQGRATGRFNDLFYRMGDFPKPLTIELLIANVEAIKAKTGSDKIIVIMDTLRSCFAGAVEDENDAAGMAKILTPLRDLTAKHNICLFLIHHNSKAADDYSGSTAILSSVDYHWNFRNDKLKNRSEINCQGRGDFVDPLELMFDRATQTNKLYVSKGETVKEPVKEVGHDLELSVIPFAGGIGIEDLMTTWAVSRRTVTRKLDDYITAGQVKRRERIKATDKVLFHRVSR